MKLTSCAVVVMVCGVGWAGAVSSPVGSVSTPHQNIKAWRQQRRLQNGNNGQKLNEEHVVSRRDSGYGAPDVSAPVPAPDEAVDLHNKEFCVDVSTFQPVVW